MVLSLFRLCLPGLEFKLVWILKNIPKTVPARAPCLCLSPPPPSQLVVNTLLVISDYMMYVCYLLVQQEELGGSNDSELSIT